MRKVAVLERGVATILVTIRLAMNETVPINRLPPEILGRVLEFREGDEDLISATHVCNRWRSALTSSPSLWTKIVFRDSSRALVYLARSGALPIDVSFIPTRASFETWKFDPEDPHTSRIPWFDRVKSIVVEGDEGQIEAILEQLCLPAPLLQSLKFSGRPDLGMAPWIAIDAISFPREFLCGQAPSLRSLSLDSISPVDSTFKLPLTNLTSLTWIDEGSKATVTGLLSLLELAPLLELLALHLRIPSVSTAERATIVALHKLRELTWSNSGGTFSLTSCLITPKLHRLSLHLVPSIEARQTDLATILPPHEGHFPLLTEPTEVRCTTRENTHSCQFKSTTSYVGITVFTRNYGEIYTSWFLRTAAIPFKQIKQMTIEADQPLCIAFPTEQFERLETLELVDSGNDYFTIIQPYFRLPEIIGTPVVPFPGLLEVRIIVGSHTSLAGLVEILMQRKQAGRGVQTVRIRGECDEAINAVVAGIRESVGEVVLQLTHKIDCTGH